MWNMKHWQDPVNAVLGLWLMVSPWLLGYQGETAAVANAVVIGMALIAAALGAMLVPRAWEEWTEFGLGLWLIVSPWIVGFATHADARLNAVIVGVLTAVLALWVLMVDRDYNAALRGGRGTAH